ncbi:hypothetical protein DFP72DRAFT_871594 [Ephemerocybe angulata]|uniref:BHLH domain-containing protein n=1 Tax=Ephemerocybe angulata TaxID=980116 RepID=A0A8H6IF80_9AGAR|nr:hypothetical protein DFP72DRAFT_871594 [Tulosesus angulatus]
MMDMQSSAQHQQQDFLSSLFPQDEARHGDMYHISTRNQGGRSNGSPASSSSSGLHDAHGGGSSTLMDSSNIRRSSNAVHSTNPGGNTMYPPSSPIQPQSPNTQLTMQLLGSLMQMQGLDNSFPMSSPQPSTGYGNHAGGTGSGGMNYGEQSFSGSTDMGNMGGGSGRVDNNLNAPSGNTGFPTPANNALLEQQIKLQQLQQLQQLQNQIFQQQIALISGQSPTTSPAGAFEQQSLQQRMPNNTTSPNFTGLPTPGPSNELRPQQPQIDFDHFSQQLPSPMSSHSHHTLPFSHQSNDYMHRGANSAPEHLAFHVRTGPTPSPHFTGGHRPEVHDLDISPLTSPWLGAAYGGSARDSEGSHDQSLLRPQDQRLQSNKRGAPPNGEDSSHSRKKHSSGMSSAAEGAGGSGGGMSMNASSSARRPYHKGSKSTTSTPLLRGSRSRSKSGAGNAFATSPLVGGGSGGHNVDGGRGGSLVSSGHSLPSVPVDSPSPVDLSMPPPPAPATAAPDPSRAPDSNLPAGFGGEEGAGASSTGSGPQLTPLTPGVVMKLGPFSSSTSSTATAAPMQATATKTVKTRSKSDAAGKKAAAGASSSAHAHAGAGLKHILPAGGPSGQNASTAGPSPTEPAGPVKKVSHKDAEQKRRDSQKTAYDELRRLLPPITFEDEQDEQGPHAVLSKKKDEIIPVRGPLPPGALPPRGPPKAGGEGPNKGVSKLQLLICGNQYIRTLKGRVERRDGEIAKLRREVGRLRRKAGGLEGRLERMRVSGVDDGIGMDVDGEEINEEEEEDEDGEIDLEWDLDAVEGMGVHIGLAGVYDDEGEE